MITVYYRKVFPLQEENTFVESMLKKTDEGRRERLLRLKNKEAQMRQLSVGCLLHDALCEWMGLPSENTPSFHIAYQSGGKPYLAGRDDVHFNISHSGEYVCVAVGNAPVGVDIQEKLTRQGMSAKKEEKIAERFFTLSDKRRLSACGEAEYKDLFFRMWSIKESYIKLTGDGMSRGLSGFEIDWQENRILDGEKRESPACFQEWKEIENYSLCVCSWLPDQLLTVKYY